MYSILKHKFGISFSSVAQLCPTLCDRMNHSMPGLPVHHQLPELDWSLYGFLNSKTDLIPEAVFLLLIFYFILDSSKRLKIIVLIS